MRPLHIVSSEVPSVDVYDEIGKTDIAISLQVVKMQSLTRPAYRGLWRHREGRAQFLRRGDLIFVACYQQSWRKPPRATKKRHGAESPQISTQCYRGRPLLIVSSEAASIDVYDEFGKMDIAIS